MPLFMWYYMAGIFAALGVGFVLYYVVGAHVMPLLNELFGEHADQLWGRTFRISLVASALLGGFAVTWHGCDGYSDYSHVADDRNVMFQKMTEQIADAMQYSVFFLVIVAAVGAIMFAVLKRPRQDKKDQVPRQS